MEGEGSRPLAKRAVQVRFGVVTAWPDEDWHSQRLVNACARLGEAATVDPSALGAFVGHGAVEFHLGRRSGASFDALLIARGLGRAGDGDVQFEIYRALEGTGALIVNRIDALLAAQDKLRTSWLLRRAGVPTPRAAVAQVPRDAVAALRELGEAVLKPIAGSLGVGLMRVRADRAGRKAVLEQIEHTGAVYLQEYVPHPGRDARLFVVGERVAGAMERVAPVGEWRTNVERGATVRALGRDGALAALALRAAQALGLDWAGVDVVAGPSGATVLEVNGNPAGRGSSWQRARIWRSRSPSTCGLERNGGRDSRSSHTEHARANHG